MEEQNEPKNFTNRELWMLIKSNYDTNLLQHKEMLKNLTDFHESTNKTLSEIVVQTKKTNGNVMDLLLWRATVKGATWIVPVLVSAIISGAVALAYSYFK